LISGIVPLADKAFFMLFSKMSKQLVVVEIAFATKLAHRVHTAFNLIGRCSGFHGAVLQ
jgi:hypothetical protein